MARPSPVWDVIADAAIGTPGPFTIGVYGGWGHGKSSVLNLARKRIDEDDGTDAVTVWFNAWQYEKEQHPVLPLAATIMRQIVHQIERGSGADEWFATAHNALRSLVYAVKMKPMGVGLDASKAVDRYDELQNRNSLQGEDTLYYSLFEKLDQASNALAATGPKIVVFIDDLDRCLPRHALTLLESIKLVLSQPGFIFVLGVNRAVLESHIQQQHRDNSWSHDGLERGPSYLDKIIQLPLPPHERRFRNYIEQLLQHPVVEEAGLDNVLEPLVEVLTIGSNMNPRSVVRFINNLLVDRRIWQATEEEEIDAEQIELIAISRIIQKQPERSAIQLPRSGSAALRANPGLRERKTG